VQPPAITDCDRSQQVDPSLVQSSSNSNPPRRRVGRPRKSAGAYAELRGTTSLRQPDPVKKVEEKKPATGVDSQRVNERLRKPRLSTSSQVTTRATTSNIERVESPSMSTRETAHASKEPSPMSRKKEPWLTALKATYGAHLGTSSRSEPQLISYPQVGDPFKTIENFKEACLLASWSAGHDMHVRNHYKTDLWERCVFTCRHDRSPPKGYNCPFKIVAMGDKLSVGQPVEMWKVIKVHLVHRNHEVGPGMFDPLGKRRYRKRGAQDSGTDGRPESRPPRKRGRPARSSTSGRPGLAARLKPPPSVALPAPSALLECESALSSADNSSSSDDSYCPHRSSVSPSNSPSHPTPKHFSS